MTYLLKPGLLIVLAGLLFSGCSMSYTVTKRQQQIKSQADVTLLRSIAMQSDNTRRVARLRSMQNNGKNSHDPVFLNILASALLIEGEYREAAALYGQVYSILDRYGHNYFSASAPLPRQLSIPGQRRSSIRITVAENAAILNGLATKVQHNQRYALLDGLRNRSGHIPDPPVLKGIIGLGLESLNESTSRTMFYPKIIPYNHRSANTERQRVVAMDYVLQNLFLAQLLDKDFEGFEQTVRRIQRLERYQRSQQLETYLAVGLYALGDRRWRNHVNAHNRSLFIAVQQLSARLRERNTPVAIQLADHALITTNNA